jgi:hypothetical protein
LIEAEVVRLFFIFVKILLIGDEFDPSISLLQIAAGVFRKQSSDFGS